MGAANSLLRALERFRGGVSTIRSYIVDHVAEKEMSGVRLHLGELRGGILLVGQIARFEVLFIR